MEAEVDFFFKSKAVIWAVKRLFEMILFNLLLHCLILSEQYD